MRSRRFVLSAAVLGCFEGRIAPGRAHAVPFALPPELLRRSFGLVARWVEDDTGPMLAARRASD